MSDPTFLAGETLPAGKLAALSPDPQPFTPTWQNVTLGSPGEVNEGVWWRIGRQITFAARFTLGTGGDVTGLLSVDLPVPADPAWTALAVCAVYGQLTASNRHSGVGIFSDTQVVRFVGVATNLGWNAAAPFDWAAGSALRLQGTYIAAEP